MLKAEETQTLLTSDLWLVFLLLQSHVDLTASLKDSFTCLLWPSFSCMSFFLSPLSD